MDINDLKNRVDELEYQFKKNNFSEYYYFDQIVKLKRDLEVLGNISSSGSIETGTYIKMTSQSLPSSPSVGTLAVYQEKLYIYTTSGWVIVGEQTS